MLRGFINWVWGNNPAPQDEGNISPEDQAAIDAALNESFFSDNDTEFQNQVAIDTLLREEAEGLGQPDIYNNPELPFGHMDRNDKPFEKIQKLIQLLGIDHESIAELDFEDYEQNCPNGTLALRQGKTFDEFLEEYVLLNNQEIQKIIHFILVRLQNTRNSSVNSINFFAHEIFSLNGPSLKFIADQLPPIDEEDDFDINSILAEPSVPTGSLPEVCSPEPNCSSSSQLITEEEQNRLDNKEIALKRCINMALRQQRASDKAEIILSHLRERTGYSNCHTFEEKMQSLESQINQVDSIVEQLAGKHQPTQDVQALAENHANASKRPRN